MPGLESYQREGFLEEDQIRHCSGGLSWSQTRGDQRGAGRLAGLGDLQGTLKEGRRA